MYTETLSPLPADASSDAFYINGLLQNEILSMSRYVKIIDPAVLKSRFVRIDTRTICNSGSVFLQSFSGLSALVKLAVLAIRTR